MFDKLAALGGGKGIGLAVGVVLASTAVIGTFASQDAVSLLEETPTATVTEEPAASETPTAEATETPTEEASETPDDATETPEATESPEASEGEEGAGREGPRGIPDDNPNFEEDDDGVCEKGESAIKTTPSGVEVMVPCHAAEKSHGKHGKHDGAGDDDASATPEADPSATPEAEGN